MTDIWTFHNKQSVNMDHPEEEEAREEEGTKRQQWSNQAEFLLSCIALTIGLGSKHSIETRPSFLEFMASFFQMFGDFHSLPMRMEVEPFLCHT